jgi:predicted RNase H-like HicB family nuclease
MKSVEAYLNLPYTVEIKPESDGTFFVCVKELEGCLSCGDTVEEAYKMIKDAMREWIGFRLEKGLPVPEPHTDEDSYRGKFIVRTTSRLHKQLAEQAKKQDVSMNAYVCELLAENNALEQVVQTLQKVVTDLRNNLDEGSSNMEENTFSGAYKYTHDSVWGGDNVIDFSQRRKECR